MISIKSNKVYKNRKLLSFFLLFCPGDKRNRECLLKTAQSVEDTHSSGKGKKRPAETWIVFITHGFTQDLAANWLHDLRRGILDRYR